MKIECVLRRKGGTHVDLGGTIYHFAPSKGDNRHTADITDRDHIGTFLAIKEAYVLAEDEPTAPVKADRPAPKKPNAPAAAVAVPVAEPA